MELQHRQLGWVKYSEDEVITFPQGLLGYLKFKQYIFTREQELSPFSWMISVEEPNVSVLVTNPFLFCPDYSPNVTKRDLSELSAENPQSLEMYSIVTMNQDARLTTANLSGPILVNHEKRIGKQLVLLDDRYSTKHRILNT